MAETDPGTVWSLTELDTDKVAAIRQRPAVNVAHDGNGVIQL